ncbi:MAG: ankyrin repeat domain-containing protein, partial [Pseudomonadota bacterium]|nr:ankyrin repeat domain-containing protein [Pseudomonadota bacterium]
MQSKFQEPLNRALKNRNQNQLTKLIAKIYRAGLIDAKFDLVDYQQITLLMLFVLSNNLNMVKKLLIECKADRLIKEADGQNALYMATHLAISSPEYDYKIATLLLTDQAKEQICSQERLTGHTVISFCAMNDSAIATGFLRLFLDITTEPLNQTTINGDYPINLACLHGEETTLNALLKFQPEKQVLLAGQFKELPLHTLLSRDLTASLALLLAHEPQQQLLSRTESGMTVLHIAALRLQFATLKFLKEHNLVSELVNVPFGEHAQTALHLAITIEHENPVPKAERHVHWFVKELLVYGADVMTGAGNLIPLLRCCQNNYVSVAKLLLAQREEEQLTNIDCENFIPIMTACFYGAHSVVDFLLEFACNQTLEHLTFRNKSGHNALHLAINHYHEHPEHAENILHMVKSLLKFYPVEQLLVVTQGINPLLRATALGFVDMVKMIMQFDCKTQLTEQNDSTILPIHFACDRENIPIVQALLQQHALAQLHTPYKGITPLQQATLNQNLELMQLILAIDPTTLLTLLP